MHACINKDVCLRIWLGGCKKSCTENLLDEQYFFKRNLCGVRIVSSFYRELEEGKRKKQVAKRFWGHGNKKAAGSCIFHSWLMSQWDDVPYQHSAHGREKKKGLLRLGMLQSQMAPIAVPATLSVLTHLFLCFALLLFSTAFCCWWLTPYCVRSHWVVFVLFLVCLFFLGGYAVYLLWSSECVCRHFIYLFRISTGPDVNTCNELVMWLIWSRRRKSCWLTAMKDTSVKY